MRLWGALISAFPPVMLALIRLIPMNCFIDPFDRLGDAVLPQRRGR
jgi:hypothetical protein